MRLPRRAKAEPPPADEAAEAGPSPAADERERMLPAAASLMAPLAPRHGESMPASGGEPVRPAARTRRPLPALGAPLAGLALALGAACAGLGALGNVLGVLLLPVGGLLLALAAMLPIRPRPLPHSESSKLRLVGLTFATLPMLVVLALVEGVAFLAAWGFLFNFSDVAAVFVRAYPVLLGAFLVVGAAVRVAAGLWGDVLEVPRRRRLLALPLAVGAGAVGALLLLAALPGGPSGLTITVERAPFVAALAVLAGLGGMWLGALPSFPVIGEWLAREGLRHARLARQLTKGFASAALASAGAGMALWLVVHPHAGLPLLALGLLLALLASYPSGVARFAPALGFDDPEMALRRQQRALRGLLGASVAGFVLAGVGLFLGLALRPAWAAELATAGAVAGVVVLQGVLALVSPRYPVPGALSEGRRAAAYDLGLLALLLTFFGTLVGSGLAQGPGVGPLLGAVLLLAALLASSGTTLLRVALGPSKAKAAKPGWAKQAEKRKGKTERDTKEQITRTMHLVYAAGLGFTGLMTALIATTSLGVFDVQESTGLSTPMLVILGALLGAPVVGIAVWRYLQVRRVEVEFKQRTQNVYKRRLTPQEVTRLALLGGSISAAVVFIILGLLTQLSVLQALGPFQLSPKFSTDFFVFAILVGLGPYGFMRGHQQARDRAIDQKFPEFLRDLAESKRAGMTLTQAVITASKGSYGALTADIRKMAAQIEWGVSFSEALERFSRRVKTPLIQRSVSLIVQAQSAGGNVVDILHAAANDAREIQLLLRERKTAMSIYVMIIYIAFFVFLAVIAILDAQFLPEVAKAVSGAQGVSVGPIKFGKIDVAAFKQVFFHAAVIQAVGGGFVAGVMEEGRAIAGLRHVFIMVIFGYVAFRFVIGG